MMKVFVMKRAPAVLIVLGVCITLFPACFLGDWGTDVADFVEKGLSVAYLDSFTVSQGGSDCTFVVPGAASTVSLRICNPKALDLEYTLSCGDSSFIEDAAVPTIASTAGANGGYTTVSFDFAPAAAADLSDIVFTLNISCPSLNKALPNGSISIYCDSPPEAPSVFKVGKYGTGFPFAAFDLPEDNANADIVGVEIAYWLTASGEAAATTYASDVSRSGSELTTDTIPELLDSNMNYRRYFIPTGTTTNGYTFRLRLKDKNAQYSPWTSDLSISASSHILTFASNASDASGAVGITFGNQGDQLALSDGKSYTRSGWAFESWNTLSDGSGTTYAGGATYTMGSSDATLYAQWVQTGDVSITLSFSSYGSIGSTVDSSSVPRGSGISCTGSLSSATAASWAWYVDGVLQATTSSLVWDTSTASVGEHIISCTAVGTDGIGYSTSTKVSVAPAYTVTYSGNGAASSSTASQSFISGGSVSIADGSDLSKTGYTFVNWNTKAEGTGTAYAVGDSYSSTANLILYAHWRLTKPVAVTALKAYARDAKVTLSWTAPTAIADLDHYEIEYYADATSLTISGMTATGSIASIPSGTLKYTVTGLTNYTQYGFIVKAVYREPTGSGTTAGLATATIYAIPGMGKAEVLTMGSNLLPMSYVPAKTVSFCIGTGQPYQDQTPVQNIYMAQTEMTWRIWYDVYLWATNPEHGSAVYLFANKGTPANGSSSDVPTSTNGVMPVRSISWRDALIWCNALTEYYNAKNGLTGSTALKCVYYTDSTYTAPLRSVDASTTLTRTIAGSQDLPYIYASSTGNTDLASCTANGFRIPSSSEWACAARYIGDFDGDGAITTDGECYGNAFPSGADAPCSVTSGASDYDGNGEIYYLNDVACYNGNTTVNRAVASYKPNMLGIYDMNGNAIEMLSDWGSYPYVAGGNWYDGDSGLICTFIRWAYNKQSYETDYYSTLRVVRNAD